MTTPVPHLKVSDLTARYGESQVLFGVNFCVGRAECVVLLGRNGAGKTTTLRSIMGLVEHQGSVTLNGQPVEKLPPHRIARAGIGYCPEERGIYATLTCEENLLMPPRVSRDGMSVEEIYGLFPNLKQRRQSQGGKLSGGEQQMLALARILRAGARLLLLDEVSEGLAPVIVDRLSDVIADLKLRGYTILLVEQNFDFASRLADRMLVLEHGQVVAEIPAGDLPGKMDSLVELLGM